MRERLAAELTTLKNDAELIGDATLQTDADAALELLARAGTGDTVALQDAIGVIADEKVAAPVPPSEETMRLLETDATQLDAELLDIYLTEADEVIDSVASNVAALKAQTDDREALTTVRRGFHTLKGSGRMVGLTELGEIAYAVEKVHNRLLEDDLPVTPAVLALIDTAQTSFRVWVDTLRRKGRVTPDPTALYAAIAKVEAEMPAPPAPQTPPAPPAPRAPPTPPAPARSAPDALQTAAAAPWAREPSAPTIEVLELDETAVADRSHRFRTRPAGNHRIRAASDAARGGRGRRSAGSGGAGAGGGGSKRRRGDAVGGAVSHPLRRGAAASGDPGRGIAGAAVRPRRDAIAGDGAGRSHLVRHPPHGGFPLVATAAKALEQCLLGLEERGAPLPATAQPVLARAIAGLHALTARVRARERVQPRGRSGSRRDRRRAGGVALRGPGNDGR